MQDQVSTENSNTCDVLVIGGGPAGSTISTKLAEAGRDVVLLEKEQHPRFHIGESLLPMNLPIFEELVFFSDFEKREFSILPKFSECCIPWEKIFWLFFESAYRN